MLPWKTWWWVARQVWSAAPRWCLVLAGCLGGQAILPPLVLWICYQWLGGPGDGWQDLDPSILQEWWWLAGIVGVWLSAFVFESVMVYARGRLQEQLHPHIMRQVLQHASRLDLAAFESLDLQDLVHRGVNHPSVCVGFILRGTDLAAALVQLVSVLAVMAWISPLFAALLATATAGAMLLNKRASRARHEAQVAATRMVRCGTYFSDRMLSAPIQPVIKLYGLAPVLIRQFERYTRDSYRTVRFALGRELRHNLAGGFLTVGLAGASLLVLGLRTAVGAMSLGAFVGWWVTLRRFGAQVRIVGVHFNSSWDSGLALGETVKLLQTQPGLTDDGDFEAERAQGTIVFEEVSFAYPGSSQPTLHEVSFRVNAGETVALVGKNGAGKSTLIKLMARLYDPNLGGRVQIDGHDARDWKLASLHRQFALAGQDIDRFEATVREHLAFGDWPRLLDDPDAVASAARDLGMQAWVDRLPEGLDTHLGRQFGTHDLSGGEWKRLAFFRAIASCAPIVLLDEPTEQLDPDAEARLYQLVRRWREGQTTVIVSHRLSTFRRADRILVLDRGRLVEQGEHDQLLAREGHYFELVNSHLQNLGIGSRKRGSPMPVGRCSA